LIKLFSEHQIILGFFSAIEAAETLDAKKAEILKLRDVVTTHLGKEDAEIYPTLANSQNDYAMRLGSVFADLMVSYANDFTEVTEGILKSAKSISIDVALNEKFIHTMNDIRKRIEIEELLLFPEYLKIHSD